ncbi:MAG: metallophosphoesterase family protein [Gemmataceae bacterium]
MPARILAIGDIHGCLVQFDALVDKIAPTQNDHLILLGDYVDRGPDSAGVISRILKLSKTVRVTCLKGNHEQMMLEAFDSQDKLSDWIRNGGDATLRSYAGLNSSLRDIPSEHWNFLENQLVDYLESESHIFVHANAYSDLDMCEQPDYMLRWERCDNISPHISDKVIVCGHTPQRSGRPLNKGFAICIDTTPGHAANFLVTNANYPKFLELIVPIKGI